MPDRCHDPTAVPGDCFLEISWLDAIGEDGIPLDTANRWAEAEAICVRYGGCTDGLEAIGPDHVPFAELFGDHERKTG
jgi:hypothetical protein